MKRISRKVREEAALICAIAASTLPELWSRGRNAYYDQIELDLGITKPATRMGPAAELAIAAWSHACSFPNWTQETDAEAEALLRTGWTP